MMNYLPIVRICIVLVTTLCATEASDFVYCEKLCLRGFGGNLCQCNAVHFTGKRSDDSMKTPKSIVRTEMPKLDRANKSIRAIIPRTVTSALNSDFQIPSKSSMMFKLQGAGCQHDESDKRKTKRVTLDKIRAQKGTGRLITTKSQSDLVRYRKLRELWKNAKLRVYLNGKRTAMTPTNTRSVQRFKKNVRSLHGIVVFDESNPEDMWAEKIFNDKVTDETGRSEESEG